MIARFENKVRRDLDGCWYWIGGKRDGYGLFRFEGRCMNAHRFVWEQTVGLIPDGLCVLHTCDHRSCVRPDHLFLGTRADNNADRDRKGRHTALLGEDHGMAKLTEDDVRVIRQKYKAGESAYALAREFGVHHTTAHRAAIGRTWRHVD